MMIVFWLQNAFMSTFAASDSAKIANLIIFFESEDINWFPYFINHLINPLTPRAAEIRERMQSVGAVVNVEHCYLAHVDA